jgi:enoyl-CoA hydratase/carnithine racemase
MTQTVTRTDRDGVTELRLDRPESRNALTTAMLEELRGHLRAVADDPSVRVVLVVGAGPAFCAGADLKEIPPDAHTDARMRRIRLVSEVLVRLMQLEQPTVAAVHGGAVGAGWGIALACDVCFAARDATFALPEVAKGLRIPQVLMSRLVHVVGPVRAAEVAYAGTTYGADAALAAGCCSRVLADREEAHAQAWELATALASRPRSSVATAREPLRAAARHVAFPPPELTWTEE